MEQTTNQTVIDGQYIVDTETGEVLGFADSHNENRAALDRESVEWALDQRMQEEAEIAALEERVNAICHNIETMIKRHENRLAFLNMRFKDQIVSFARENLPKGSKTWVSPYGKVAFRMGREKHEIIDQELAVKWADENAPEAVKRTVTVLVSKLPDEAKTQNWMLVTPPTESVVITTGVKERE